MTTTTRPNPATPGRKVGARVCVDDFFSDLSAAANGGMKVRERYAVLGRVLRLAVDQRLEGVKVCFAGLYPKIQYLVRECRIRENSKDHTLVQAINDTRNRLRHIETTGDAELEAAFAGDLKAVCKFVSVVYGGATVPNELERHYERETFHTWRRRLKDAEGEALAVLRCTVERWNDTTVFASRSDTGEDVEVVYVEENKYSMGNWGYLSALLYEGAQLNIVKPREEDGRLYGELFVLDPDNLINVTAVAACFEEYGCSARLSLVNKLKPAPASKAILLGNYAGQLLDEAVYDADTGYADSLKHFFSRHALAFACCPDELDADFHREAQRQRANIRNIMANTLKHKKEQRPVQSGELILEPSFFCETLGLQGRMDLIHVALDTVVEQKGGKAAYGSTDTYVRQQQKHYVQLLLYRAMLHYAYGETEYSAMASYLLYSKYASGLVELGSAPQLLFEAVRMRNQIAWSERWYAQHGMDVLATLTADSIFPACHAPLWERYNKPAIEALLAPVREADAVERAYYLRFMRFVAAEHMLSKVGSRTKEDSGFATVWNSSVADKRLAGNIYERLVMEHMEPCDEQEDIVFRFDGGHDADMSNFRVGDIVMFYPYRQGDEPDATATLVFRCTVTDIRADKLFLRLRNPQNTKVFERYNDEGVWWAVEHDFMESSYSALYRALHAFLSAPKVRRQMVLGQRKPVVDTSLQLMGNYSQGSASSAFNDLVLHVLQAQDLYLVIGPPGTGKTSYGMLNVLKEHLLHPTTTVLLTAYTNRAVDEICSKLVESDIDFVRLGSDFSCAPPYRDHLLSNRVAAMDAPRVDSVRDMLERSRVVCGTLTAFGSHAELFSIKHFDLAIVDEASQILEPHIMPLLAACHNGVPAVGKFVLIGDEKQLPAVVQQEQEVSKVEEAELNAIGLTDCRLSFFERMLRLLGKDNPAHSFLLNRQGRMHPDIADFPNVAFYNNMLQPVPLPHQEEPTADEGKGADKLEDLLLTHRLAFIDCEPCLKAGEADKVNSVEASVIADVVVTARKMLGEAYDVASSIGVIVPYRNQISTVRMAIDAVAASAGFEDLHDIAIDTVERYQGSQRDVIVYGFTAKRPYQLAFLTDTEYFDETDNAIIDRKLNVAMTRARKRLVLVGYAALLRRDTTFRRLIEYAERKHAFFKDDFIFQ